MTSEDEMGIIFNDNENSQRKIVENGKDQADDEKLTKEKDENAEGEENPEAEAEENDESSVKIAIKNFCLF